MEELLQNPRVTKFDPPQAPVDKAHDFDGPRFSAEGLARSVFGRHYWNDTLERQLRRQSAQSAERIEAQRRAWKRAGEDKAKLVRAERQRKSRAVADAVGRAAARLKLLE